MENINSGKENFYCWFNFACGVISSWSGSNASWCFEHGYSQTLTSLSALPPSGFPMKHVFLLISSTLFLQFNPTLHSFRMKLLKAPSDQSSPRKNSNEWGWLESLSTNLTDVSKVYGNSRKIKCYNLNQGGELISLRVSRIFYFIFLYVGFHFRSIF